MSEILYSDSFGRPDSTGLGSDYNPPDAGFDVVGGVAVSTGGDVQCTAVTPPDDQAAQCKVVDTGGIGTGVTLRHSNSTNFYFPLASVGSGTGFWSEIGGGFNEMASDSEPWASGDSLYGEFIGTTGKIKRNDVVLDDMIVTDAGLASGFCGMVSFNTGDSIDDFKVIDPAGSGGSTPTITSVGVSGSNTFAAGDTGVPVVGTNLGATTGDRTFSLIQSTVEVDQTQTSGDATSGEFTVVTEPGSGGDIKFGDATFRVTVGSDTADQDVTVNPASGQIFVDIATPDTEADNRITAVGDIASGDQIHARGVGGGAVPTGLQLNDDGTFEFTSGHTPASFDVRVWDHTDQTWGSFATQTITIHADLSVTLGSLTASSAGQVAVAGTFSKTLGALTSSSTGQVAVSGTLSKTLGTLTSSSAGQVAVTGTFSKTLGALTSSAAGTISLSGTASVTLGAATLSAVGSIALVGSSAITFGALTLSSAGQIALTGALAETLGAISLSATGVQAGGGAADITLGAITVSSASTISLSGALSYTLGALTVSSASAITLSGVLSYTLGSLTVSSAGQLSLAASVSSTLGILTLDAQGSSNAGAVADITLDALTISSTGVIAIAGALSKTLGAATLSAGGTVSLSGALGSTLGAVTVTSTGVIALSGAFAKTLGLILVDAEGVLAEGAIGDLVQTLGALTLSSAGTNPLVGQLAKTLGSLVLSAIGQIPLSASLSAELGELLVSSTATKLDVIEGDVNVQLGELLLDSRIYPTILGTFDRTLGALIISARGNQGLREYAPVPRYRIVRPRAI